MGSIIYDELKKGDIVFFARILPKNRYYKVIDLRIVSAYEEYCTGTDLKTKQTYVFDKELAEKALFHSNAEASEYINSRKINSGCK